MTGVGSDTLVGILEAAARRFGPRPALIARRGHRIRRWSYAELWDASARTARLIRSHGVGPGDRVVLWGPNDPLWVIALFGLQRLGAVAVPIDARSTVGFVAGLVTQTEPRLALLARPQLAAWLPLQVPHLPLEELEDLSGAKPLGSPPSTLSPGDVAEVIFTSGTTGVPKGVILTHGNIAANVRALAEVMPPHSSDRLLSLLPLSHMLGQTVGLLLPLSGGGSVVFPGGLQPTQVFRSLQEHSATAIVLVPQILQMFLDAIEREVERAGEGAHWRKLLAVAEHLPMSFRRVLFRKVHRRLGGRLRFIVSGGARLDPGLARRWEALGIPIVQGYGTTEASPVVTATSVAGRRPGSVGKPLPGQSIRIADDAEILIAGPNVTPGYWRNPEATQAAFEDGWYRTGDIGELDADGYLYLKGRKKDVIVLASGLNVHTEDVEHELRREPEVRDAAVVGLEEPAGPVRVHAILVGPATLTDAEAIVRRVNGRLAPHQRVQGVSLWPGEDLPRTPTLKVKKHELIPWVLSGQGPQEPTPQVAATTDPARLVARLVKAPWAQIAPDARLGADLGVDSLGRVALLAAIETELGAAVDEERVDEFTTVAELERLVAQAANAPQPGFQRWPLAPWCRALRTVVQEALVFPLLRFWCAPRVEGRGHLDQIRGPAIFAPNHASHLDSPAVLWGLPTHIRRRTAVAAAADYFFVRRWLGITVSVLLNAFPFSREGAVRPTLEWCGHLVDEGWSLVVFPEGTRSTTGDIAPFRPGIGLMAVDLAVPVVPVRLQGTYGALPKGQAWPRHHPVTVTFGRPLRFPRDTPYQEATRTIEAAVRAL